ncbi:GPO family capsid scaffolding protein [Azonexus sp. R2A61]|uniref:GPO family capsid scaffolding protein n=1 Tax=Azonexus sp. R2A61 TaxID=2744443 RepID=UPI001F314A55|nr:GPO family capsid scaffolding protein [Azonexus sp. R2A61]
MPISKPFAIATEGSTVDGRKISREWLTQMAANYSPKVYTAVANLEHYLSSLPDSVFGAYGKVISLSTRETDILGEKRLQLMGVVDANEELVALQQKGKKAFASIEVLDNFANKGIAYLGGLAFTDRPASLATESMKFSVAGAAGERFAFKDEIEIEFEPETKPETKPGDTLFAKVKDLLGISKKDNDGRFADQANAITAVAESQKALLDNFASFEQQVADAGAQVKKLTEEFAAAQKDYADLKKTLSETDGDPKKRPNTTGGNGTITTDC